MRLSPSFVIVAASLAGCETTGTPASTSSNVGTSETAGTAAANTSASMNVNPPNPPAPLIDPNTVGKAFVEELGRADYAAAVRRFGPEVAKALSADQLKDAWEKSIASIGAFKSVGAVDASPRGEGVAVQITAIHEKGTIKVKLGMKVGYPLLYGVFFDKPKPPYDPPKYADPSKLTATELKIGDGKAALPGTLTVPNGAGPFPVVLLVHGSGPNDQDESLGPNRPFRDIAEGLATKGVAVLRWDKRTLHLGGIDVKPDDITVKEEYLDDVAMAVAFAKTQPNLDPKRIFVLGHSQGGWLLPWFLEQSPDVRGGIALAANARHMLDVLVPQYEYLAKLDDDRIGPLEQVQIDSVRDKVLHAKEKTLARDKPKSELPLNIPAAYWLALQSYDAVAAAKKIKQPLLFLNGGRDYQVTVKDELELWKTGLAGRADTETKVYPTLNHAFIAGEGKPGPSDYDKPGHVDAAVIEDIAKFVEKHK
jgi:uncharacterized protein